MAVTEKTELTIKSLYSEVNTRVLSVAAVKSGVMQWNFQGFPTLMHNFNYSNGNLIIPKDGYYYIFSKVSFKTCSIFKHEVKLKSSRYSYQPISFMTDMRYTHIHMHTHTYLTVNTSAICSITT